MKFTTYEMLLIKQALFADESVYSNSERANLKKKLMIWDGYYFKVKDAGSFNDGDIVLQIWKKTVWFHSSMSIETAIHWKL